MSVMGIQNKVSHLWEENLGACIREDELLQLPQCSILEMVITITENKAKQQKIKKPSSNPQEDVTEGIH